MSSTATRLTCFAILSSVEEDLRSAILHATSDEDDAKSLLNGERYEKALVRRSRDIGDTAKKTLGSLVPYLDFSDAYEVLSTLKHRLPEDTQKALEKFASRIAKLTQVRNRVAHTRPMEVDDLAAVYDTAEEARESSAELWTNVAATLRRIEEDPAYVLGLKISLVADPDKAPQHNLPAPEFDETGFFGRRKEVDRIKKAINGAYPVVSILGDGGIGKTSIALKAAYELLDDPKNPFDAFVWVSAKATILTVNEIRRISDAIESSLGLFASAAEQLGGKKAASTGDPMEEVLEYLAAFRVLLILDNLETVLDQRLRDFLLDLPMGSKVMITSRIGLGIENPVSLAPLSDHDATRLLYALARIRDVKALQGIPASAVTKMVQAMKGHPAYIRWFVSGVQAGKRPEELLQGNDLLLDFCMSNVYGYLSDAARSVLRSMQVLPGRRSQAELAFINDYSANAIQSSLLELMTTNFVQMHGASMGDTSETTYHLSDFGKQYLDTRHAVRPQQRLWFETRSKELTELGVALQAESTASPYDPRTIDVKGPGDFSVARILREALREYDRGEYDTALVTCREAQTLAPGYHESWRIEAFVHTETRDTGAARAAYERAIELAPASPTLNYFYGSFLVNDGSDPQLGLELLQKSAVIADVPPSVILEITWAHMQLNDFDSAVTSAAHVISLRPSTDDGSVALTMGGRAAVYGFRKHSDNLAFDKTAELIEVFVELAEGARVEMLYGEGADRLIQLAYICDDLSEKVDDDFLAASFENFSARLRDRLRALDPDLLDRRIGIVKNKNQDRLFGFLRSWRSDYFFHLSNLCSQEEWGYLSEGVIVAFDPVDDDPRGERATRLRWLG
ncbi:NB-ARC domain-containing protein [Streptomyces ardesiacus]|uniref:NB-ARC domain-containing protein n=2 Tax=Streptomyces ardesiacus TaxID=285564 RepID=UPI00099E39D1|nr:NB-ARC domain-containing protein [Streptomyces ardesiacus]MCL7369079.1 NB-ARC domain-containing protein [Streptomyces ardesiacus]